MLLILFQQMLGIPLALTLTPQRYMWGPYFKTLYTGYFWKHSDLVVRTVMKNLAFLVVVTYQHSCHTISLDTVIELS